MSHALQRGFVVRLAVETWHPLINLLLVYVVIVSRKVARDRQRRHHSCVIVHGLVRYLERHTQSPIEGQRYPPVDDAISSNCNFVARLHLAQRGRKIVWVDLLAQ
jgi:hypothetical protein